MLLTAAILCLPLTSQEDAASARSNDAVIATVGKEQVTEAHLKLVALLAGQKPDLTDKLRQQYITRLIENRLVHSFLKRAKRRVKSSELTQAVKDARLRAKADGIDLRKELKALGLSSRSLSAELETGLLWERYRKQAITPDAIKKRFESNKPKYDGTMIRASQILVKVPARQTDWSAARKTLESVRAEVTADKTSFEDAAKKHSQAPSGKTGGDMGFFPYVGLMPRVFSELAFSLKEGEITQPFRSRYGAHLLKVTKIKKGDLSLEDARLMILRELEKELWADIVRREKQQVEVRLVKP